MAEAVRSRPARAPLLARLIMLFAICFAALVAQPAAAQSMLRDAETESLLRDISRPLIEAAGLRPDDVRIVLLNNNEINAFVAGGQIVYLHSGLIAAAENANEVQGVIAHELGHVAGGHVIRGHGEINRAIGITLLSLLIGVAAMAAGAGEAGAGIMGAGQTAAMGTFLAFSRSQEATTDQMGANYLSRAGISGRGSLAFFNRLQNMEYRLAIPQNNGYARTHPLSRERIVALEHRYQADAAWDRPTDSALEARFQRVRAKLIGFVDEPRRTLTRYPQSDRSVPARYARAYALHRDAHPERALAEVEALLATAPEDPYYLELRGQILLESGRPREALEALRLASARAPDQPLIAALLGHALIATEDPAHYAEAERVLRVAVGRDNSNPFAWYQLGVVYEHNGDRARAALATAERYNLQGQARMALVSAEQALLGIPVGTPDWLRAQDIAMVSRTAVERERRR